MKSINNKISFKWSTQVIIITTIITFVLLLSVYKITTDDIALYVKLPLSITLTLVLFLGLINTPINVRINKDYICINKLWGKKTINANEIKCIEQISVETIKKSNRTFGSGGFFGYFGKFSNNNIGSFRLFATELDNFVLIKTDKEKIVINCSDYNIIKNTFGKFGFNIKNTSV